MSMVMNEQKHSEKKQAKVTAKNKAKAPTKAKAPVKKTKPKAKKVSKK